MDWIRETPLTMREAAEQAQVHYRTVVYWCRVGLVGPDGEMIKLEHIKKGGRRITSVDALDRFYARLNGSPVATTVPLSKRLEIKRQSREAAFALKHA